MLKSTLKRSLLSPTPLLLLLQTLLTKSLSHTPIPTTTTTTTTTTTSTQSQTVSYLINSCGLSPESALLASRQITLKTTSKPNSVLHLLRSFGFANTHLSKIIAKQPSLLLCDADRILKPKLDFLTGVGFSGPSLTRILTLGPLLLRRSLDSHLVPCLAFLRSILGSDEAIVTVFSCAPRALKSSLRKTMVPSINALRDHGLPEPRIVKLIKVQPGILQLGQKKVSKIVEDVKGKGIETSDLMFIYAFGTLSGMTGATWDRKMRVYMDFGLSEGDVLVGFRKMPICMKISDEKIRRGMDFFVNRLKILPAVLMKRQPRVLFSNLENTIIPRCSVLGILMSKGKVKRELSLISALTIPRKLFFKRYVSRYEKDVPEVVNAYQGEVEFKGFDMGS